MIRKTLILSSLMLLFYIMAASAQTATSDKLRPKWLHKLPAPTNSSFKYEIASASATSLDAVRNQCLSELISSSGLSTGVVVTSDYKSNEKLSQLWDNGKLTERVDYNAVTTTSVKSKEIHLFVENIDEYWTRDNSGNYYMTKLYAKSELGQAPLFDNVELTTNYASDPATWGLALIPGAAQIHKGSYLKGGLILGGTVALVGGIIFTETQRADYVSKIAKTHNADLKRAYATKRDHFATGRNICIGAVSALYVYNLIDAIVTPGARRIVVHQRPNGNTYTFIPTISTEGNPMMTASITF
ncbi:MAG: hypothetical protein J1F40_02465 [Prevotellaceae bacterium]|nr:hypothetical protein [Prevotellaceae bacterium]